MPANDTWHPNDRFLYLSGEITDEQSRELIARIIENWQREFVLVINSDGGSSFNALALVNLMKQHGRIDTVCVGVALSGAADCLAAGRRRYIVPGAIAMLHQVSWELGREFAANMVKNAEFLHRLNGLLETQLAEFTGQATEKLARDMATDFYLFGQEIIDYGLADEFWDPSVMLPPPAIKPGKLRSTGNDHRAKAQKRER
jgi:ATP-dependent Clp endopeptidase proteolytic subunit ClpP